MSGFMNPLARWNERFERDDYVFGEAPNAYLATQDARLQPGNALALADGEGRNSVWLARQGLQVDAFDFSPPAVAKAKRLADKAGVTVNFSCCDWASFDWKPDHYDNVVGIFFQFAEPAARARLFERIDHTLKPGGLLIIQGYGREQMRFNTGGPGKLEHLYDEALMRSAFAGYEMLELVSYEAEISEGSGHQGMSALLGMVARKPA